MAAQHADRRRAIESALLDFHRTPGRHTLALRQPALLFACIREVLQLAGGRSPDDDAPPPRAAVVQAARFFIRAALLQPHADHYALLGLTRDAQAGAIKERYRSMMRLMHPDFAQSSAAADWPADAATRINQAYEVLSSPERRRAYDEETAPAVGMTHPAPPRDVAKSSGPSRAPAPRRGASRRILPRLAAGFGALGGLALVGMWVSTAQNDRDTLVQRTTPRIDKFPALFAAAAPAVETRSSPTPEAAIDASMPITYALPALTTSSAPTPAIPPISTQTAPQPASVAASAPTPSPTPSEPPAPSAISTAVAAPSAAAPSPTPAPVLAQAPVAPSPPPARVPAPPARPAASPGPTMAEVQPVLTQLLKEMESGWGDNVIALLDTGARRATGAQALARQLDTLADGVRPVKVAKVDFRSEPRDGHLVVSGLVTLQVRDTSTRQLALQAEFATQGSGAVLTRLTPLATP